MKKIEEKVENKEVVEEKIETKNKKKIFKRIFDVVFWVAIVILFFVWVFDFVKFKQEKKPSFCIKNNVYEFDDGTVEECIGLGYKVYYYDRKSINIKTQFGPFFVKMKK